MDFKFTEKGAEIAPENKIDLSRVVFSGQYEDTPELKELVISEGVEEICENAFRDFQHLEKVTLFCFFNITYLRIPKRSKQRRA